MKFLALLLFVIAAYRPETRQLAAVVANETENAVYLGLESKLQALIENSSGKSVILTTDNGHIDKIEDNRFTFVPSRTGIANVRVCKMRNNDTAVINTWQFRVRQMPEPVSRIGLLSGGHFKKENLLRMGGIIARLECCGFDYPVTIDGFTLIAMRDSSIIASLKVQDPGTINRSFNFCNNCVPTIILSCVG